ncbi:Dual specificity protein phosphatase 14-like [Oopsacas minuta]|uniref:Dual specificity protein phosphatase 14-like n=1 Tax=Oopsacas minuta TaxID=111878 RepID=A0AAV7JZS0_9METZ|nr:Dual specificity protein phosphatase 14-like [Oopsacas minuta]
MNELAEVTDYLFICNLACLQNLNLKKLNISLVIAATLDLPSNLPEGVECVQVPVDDKHTMDISQYFDKVTISILHAREKDEKSLVYCVAGVSRSATLVLNTLMTISGINLKDSHSILKSKRRFIRPNFGFWSQLCERELQLFGHNSVVMVTSAIGAIPDLYKDEVDGML